MALENGSSSASPRPAGAESLAYYKTQYEQLEAELADFQASSKELEAELEKDVEASEKRERELQQRVESLNYEVEEWKVSACIPSREVMDNDFFQDETQAGESRSEYCAERIAEGNYKSSRNEQNNAVTTTRH